MDDPTNNVSRKALPASIDAVADALDAEIKKLDPIVPHGITLTKVGEGSRRLFVTSNGRDYGERLTFSVWETDEVFRAFPVPRGSVTIRAGDLPALARVIAGALRRAQQSVRACAARDQEIRDRRASGERWPAKVEATPPSTTTPPEEKP